MSNPQGKFCWYELMTTDTEAAKSFYKTVIGWVMQDSGMPEMDYTILNVGQYGVGGLMKIPQEACDAGARPSWAGYIWVENVDDFAAKVTAAGGKIHRAPDDIPGVGRFAVAADPQGAAFILFRDVGMERPPAPAAGTQGLIGWHELHATDPGPAFNFYAGLFGWTKGEAHDMGPMGVYQLFATGDGPVGGMMKKPDAFPASLWLYYFNVDDIDAAAGRIKSAGGQVLMGPAEVPGGSWILQGLDPQGVMFALLGPRR